ncbi:MAG: polysaccharide deacetylase family protein [Flavobacteriales bacterium]
MLLIYTTQICNVLHYACSAVLRDCESAWQLTSDFSAFENYQGPKINYSITAVKDAVHVWPANEIHHFKPTELVRPALGKWRGMQAIYPTEQGIGIDIFFATFYMLARCDEYNAKHTDELDRYTAADSLYADQKFYRKPWVDYWIIAFSDEIKSRWPEVIFRKVQYRFISTIDVDSAFAYRHKGLVRTLGGMGKDLVHFRFANLCNRILTLLHLKPDVYDTYNYIMQKSVGIETIFFFLLADYGSMDKNVPHTSKSLQALVRNCHSKKAVGLHPGVASNSDMDTLKLEKARLEEITHEPCTRSRQHYLMLRMPHTYRALLACGITDDYTMGYADDVGFRAGTCRSFSWFDWGKDEATKLTIHPFAAMDATLNRYLNLQPAEAIALHNELISEVKKVNGIFISLWHNETLCDEGIWKGWREVWEDLLLSACE